MQRLIAMFVIAIALTPNAVTGAELGLGELKPQSNKYNENFDGSYSDQPQAVTERKLSRKTEKVMKYMARVGLDGAGVKKITYFVNDRVEDNKFRIASGEYKGFKMQFSHDIALPSTNKFELRLTNEKMPSWEVKGTSRGVMMHYKYEW